MMLNDYNNPNDYWHNHYDPYRDMSDEERLKAGCMQGSVIMVAVIIAMMVCALFTSCKSVEYVFVPQTHTDTLIVTNVQHDSIYINDSTVITEKGDTVTIEKWHTKYVEKQVHDTTYVSKTDSIPVPCPVETIKEVPAELTWWQQTRIHIGGIVIFSLLIWLSIKYLFPLIRRRFGW